MLRNRKQPVEGALGLVSAAMQRQFPPHIQGLAYHSFVVPAYVGGEGRLYTIELSPATPGRPAFHRYTQHVSNWTASGVTTKPRFGLSGSGALYLIKHPEKQKHWGRLLLHLIKAHDNKVLPAYCVADQFAKLNNEVSKNFNSVGHRCIVSWLLRKGGGGQQYYSGVARDAASPGLPSVGTELGFNIDALTQVVVPHMKKQLQAMMKGEPFVDMLDDKTLNEEHDRISPKADETLK